MSTTIPVETPLLCCSFSGKCPGEVAYSYKSTLAILRSISSPASPSSPPLLLRDLHCLAHKDQRSLDTPIILVRGGCLVILLPPLRGIVSQSLAYFFPPQMGIDAATLFVLGELESQVMVNPSVDLRYAALGACCTASVSALGAQVAVLKTATESCLSAIPSRNLPSPQVLLEARNCKQAAALVAKEARGFSNALDAFLAHPITINMPIMGGASRGAGEGGGGYGGGMLIMPTPGLAATVCTVGAHLDALEATCAALQLELEQGEETLAASLDENRRVVSQLELTALSTSLFLSVANLVFSFFAMNLNTGSFVYNFGGWLELVALSLGCAVLLAFVSAYHIFKLPVR